LLWFSKVMLSKLPVSSLPVFFLRFSNWVTQSLSSAKTKLWSRWTTSPNSSPVLLPGQVKGKPYSQGSRLRLLGHRPPYPKPASKTSTRSFPGSDQHLELWVNIRYKTCVKWADFEQRLRDQHSAENCRLYWETVFDISSPEWHHRRPFSCW
jgi:hypothetical protein